MRRACIIIAACLLITACAAPKVVQDYQRDSVVVIRDSVVVIRDTVRFRDSLVLVPVPQGSDKAVLPDSDTSRLETDIAESVAYVADGQLHHALRNKDAAPIPVTIKLPERIHSESRITTTDETRDKIIYNRIVETVEVEKELSRLQRFMMSLGWVVLIGTVAWLAWKIYRLVRL